MDMHSAFLLSAAFVGGLCFSILAMFISRVFLPLSQERKVEQMNKQFKSLREEFEY